MTLRVFPLQNVEFICVGLRWWSLLLKLSKGKGFCLFYWPFIVHSCFTSSIFVAQTLDFKVKFGFVFRSEAVVFRRYVLALLSVGLLRKFEAYLVYLSVIRSYFPRCISFFQKFLHFTYMLLRFHLIIPSFPAQIDDVRSRFSALSSPVTQHACFDELFQRSPI